MTRMNDYINIIGCKMAFLAIVGILFLATPAPLSVALAQEIDATSTCDTNVNLIQNGSFETPIVAAGNPGWEIFDSVINDLVWVVSWINPGANTPAVAKLELQNGRPASVGSQYAELDSNYTQPGDPKIPGDAAVEIMQLIPTIVGATYTLSYDFSPIPGQFGQIDNNVMNVIIDNVVVDTKSATGASNTTWVNYSYTFIATKTVTEVGFADAGIANTYGTFVDNVSLYCNAPNDGAGGSGSGNNNNAGGGGTRLIRKTPTPQVLGDSTVAPLVLGDQVTVVPTGAANAGGGGASPVAVDNFSLAAYAILDSRRVQAQK